MVSYEIRWDDSRTARIRPAAAEDLRPVAWFRVSYRGLTHEVDRVDVYTHAERVHDRLWRGSVESVADAITFCAAHEVELVAARAGESFPDGVARPPVHPWGLATVVDRS